MFNDSVQPILIPIDSHQFLDRVNLMYHQAIASKLLADPEAVLGRARKNIERWALVHEGTFSAISLEEWRRLLNTQSLLDLVAVITDESDEGQRLRQSTPFTGILTESEREDIWRRCEERKSARPDKARERG